MEPWFDEDVNNVLNLHSAELNGAGVYLYGRFIVL